MPDGVWTCPRCRGPNGSRRTTCALCGAPAPGSAPWDAPQAGAPPPPWTVPVAPPTPEPAPPPAPPAGAVAPARSPASARRPGARPAKPLPVVRARVRAPSDVARAADERRRAAEATAAVETVPGGAAACPVCGSLLAPGVFEHGRTLDCARCGGRWLDATEAARVFEGPRTLTPVERAAVRARWPWSPAAPPRDPDRPCPRCRVPLGRRAATPAGPAWVDACDAGHGTWFDRGELDRCLAFSAEGGLALPPPPKGHGFPLLANDEPPT